MSDPYEHPAARVAESRDPDLSRAASQSGGRTRRLAATVALGALVLADALSFAAAWGALGMVAWASRDDARAVAVIALAGILLLSAAGIYPGRNLHGRELLRRRASAGIKLAVVALVTSALFGGATQVAPAMALVILALVLQPFLRAATRVLLDRAGLWRRKAVVIGGGNAAPLVRDYFNRNRHFGIDIGRADSSLAQAEAELALVAAPYPDPERLDAIRRQHRETVLLGDLPCLPAAGLLPLAPAGEIGLSLAPGSAAAGPRLIDRVVDIPIAVVAIVLTGPIMLLAAAAISLLDPGPVIYRQSREGLDGRPFRIFKLRTMYRNADERLEALLQADPAARAEWASHYKLRNDPRVLPVIGNALRSTSIDELPQFFNVLAGDMRIIGPRPFPFYHLAAMDQGFRIRRSSVMPGVTGLWQISERSEADVERQQRLDEYYLDHRSIWFDIEILFGTMLAVFRRNGAF
jgi:lipopolysaccharide/colanic/teichoic acid biosynthesis glycosyltransferase